MAREVYSFPITVPAGTLSSAPQVTQMSMPPRDVQEVEVLVPPGPRGEVGFRVGSSGTQVLPQQPGQWTITDNEIIHWPLEGHHDSGSWEFTGYNTGLFDHTVTVRFLVNLPAGMGPPGPAPAISNATLNGGAVGVGVPPPVSIPPLPALPPVPLPQLPPPPPLPPVPQLLGPPLPAGVPVQPVFNWWYDAMGRLLTYPDQTNTSRFDELFVAQDGGIAWASWTGGAGQWESWGQGLTELGGQFVDVSGAFTFFAGVVRLNVVAVAADGRRAIKVMNAQDFSLIQDWVWQPTQQQNELAWSKRAGLV